MITHYLKIAFRNMRKYKNQTLISVIGLAVGFTCFALSMMWIRYEMTFDSFHRNAKRIYALYSPSVFSSSGYDRNTTYRMSYYLKETFPEIANAAPLTSSSFYVPVYVEDVAFPVLPLRADTSFFRIFDVKILEGSRDFLIPGSNKLAITYEKARQLFGNEHPIGKTVNLENGEFTICAIVSGIPKRSNYAFDLIQPFSESAASNQTLGWGGVYTVIELLPGTNVKAFEQKLFEHKFSTWEGRQVNRLIIRPITKLRYTDPEIRREVKFQHIVIFAVSGVLVILCSLFNYLTLFVSRFRMRQKELALRVVCGASGSSLLAMLSVEFMLALLSAVVLGCMLTQLLHKPFLTLSEIQMSLPAIYRESLIYFVGIILISLMVFWLILFMFRRRSLNVSIRRSNKNLSRKTSVVVQLIISIGFAFCTIIILKQMYFLHHTDELGFSFKNRGSVVLYETPGRENVLANQLKQIPEIIEIVDAGSTMDLLSPTVRISYTARTWDDKPVDAEHIDMMQMEVSPEYLAFYDLRIVAGETLNDADPESLVMLNESAVKAFGWHDPVGKHINENTVKGVIKNIYNLAPTIEAKPIVYKKGKNTPMGVGFDGQYFWVRNVLFKYQEGTWKSCKEKIEQMLQKNFADLYSKRIINNEETYNEFLKSENALIKLLFFVSAICVLICIFGFVSLVSLTCEERRKEISIRKINGATAGDILAIFAKEYFLLLLIGSVIAFTTGYYIMQRWLEHYVVRTSIPVWIYLGIVFVLALVIVLCVGWQVYRASVENPAEVVKSE